MRVLISASCAACLASASSPRRLQASASLASKCESFGRALSAGNQLRSGRIVLADARACLHSVDAGRFRLPVLSAVIARVPQRRHSKAATGILRLVHRLLTHARVTVLREGSHRLLPAQRPAIASHPATQAAGALSAVPSVPPGKAPARSCPCRPGQATSGNTCSPRCADSPIPFPLLRFPNQKCRPQRQDPAQLQRRTRAQCR